VFFTIIACSMALYCSNWLDLLLAAYHLHLWQYFCSGQPPHVCHCSHLPPLVHMCHAAAVAAAASFPHAPNPLALVSDLCKCALLWLHVWLVH
jgi:hypothetical protein